MTNQTSIKKEPNMRQLFLEKWRLLADALAGIDDPQGEYLNVLENRVRRLEGDVEDLRKRFLMNVSTPGHPSDVPPKG